MDADERTGRTTHRRFDRSAFWPADGSFGCGLLAITARQVDRLLIRFREDDGGGHIHT
jgi:hypothetical protein